MSFLGELQWRAGASRALVDPLDGHYGDAATMELCQWDGLKWVPLARVTQMGVYRDGQPAWSPVLPVGFT